MQLEAFQGVWRLSRVIQDAQGQQTGHLNGLAHFKPDPDGLAYTEEGLLIIAGGSFAAIRRYHWRNGAAGCIEICFKDGRFFHCFSSAEEMPVANHECGADHYRVRYDFRRWPLWQAEWRVTGPAKDYRLKSDYRPTGQESEISA